MYTIELEECGQPTFKYVVRLNGVYVGWRDTQRLAEKLANRHKLEREHFLKK